MPSLGQAGLAAFVWSIVPAVLTALILAVVVWRTGGFNWLLAVVVAVIAFAIAAMLLPLGLDHARPYLAFLAGLVSLAVRQVLVQADIIARLSRPRNQISRLSVSLNLDAERETSHALGDRYCALRARRAGHRPPCRRISAC